MTIVKMWGHSAALRIPAALMKQANLSVNQQVKLRAEEGRLVVEPDLPTYDIDELVAAITPENLHGVTAQPMVGAEEIEW